MNRKLLKLTMCMYTVLQLNTVNAQTLFLENFESVPVTSVVNSDGTALINGLGNCIYAGRVTAAVINSTNVNFNSTQNSSYFLGHNPENPCGGYTVISLKMPALNFSGTSSLHFKCRYFMSNTLAWGGPPVLKITFSNGTSSFTLNSQFSVQNNWANLDVALPNYLIAPSVTITIDDFGGGGEGAGLDDIEIVNTSASGINQNEQGANIQFYPNPFSESIILNCPAEKTNELIISNSLGAVIYSAQFSGYKIINTENWPCGIYYYQLTEKGGAFSTGKLFKQ